MEPIQGNLALSRIPYTGVEFGATGDILYWLGLSVFSLLGAYLIVYYKGGATSFYREVKEQFLG